MKVENLTITQYLWHKINIFIYTLTLVHIFIRSYFEKTKFSLFLGTAIVSHGYKFEEPTIKVNEPKINRQINKH